MAAPVQSTTVPVLDDIPPGTRPWRYMVQPLSGDFREMPEMLKLVRDDMLLRLDTRPHVMLLLDRATALERMPAIAPWDGPDDLLLIAFWLKAIPGASEYVVYRAASDLSAGCMPERLEGRWNRRADIPDAIIRVPGLDWTATVAAHETGRVEIREDGAIAEVFEVRP